MVDGLGQMGLEREGYGGVGGGGRAEGQRERGGRG